MTMFRSILDFLIRTISVDSVYFVWTRLSAAVLVAWAATSSLSDSVIIQALLIVLLALLLVMGIILLVRGSVDLIRDLRTSRMNEPRNHTT
jgi:hypothetical protein